MTKRGTILLIIGLVVAGLLALGAQAALAGQGYGRGYGPGDGTGNDRLGPRDGTGFGPGPGSGIGVCDGTGPHGLAARARGK